MLCGNPEQLGSGVPSLKLPTNRPKVLIVGAPPGFTLDDVWAWCKESHSRWTLVCDWLATRIMDATEAKAGDVVQLVTAADLGGGGVLADQVLPYTGAQFLRMRLNSNPRVKWEPTNGQMRPGTVDPYRAICHEIGHYMGMQHLPSGPPPDLMEPAIRNDVIRPQVAEAKQAAAWFGAPTTAPPVPPPPTWLLRSVVEFDPLSLVVRSATVSRVSP